MKILDRSYSSSLFRPKPVVHIDRATGLLLVVTSWGRQEHADLVVSEVAKYMTSARGDVEVTSHFEVLPTLTKDSNDLRVALMMVNDLLYRGDNRSEYMSGLEIVALVHEGRKLSWAQVGAPHLLLHQPGQVLLPLSLSHDHGLMAGAPRPPLPSRLLGVERFCQINCGDFFVTDEDEIALLASSRLPTSLWRHRDPLTLEDLTDQMVAEDQESPFWLGLVTFTD